MKIIIVLVAVCALVGNALAPPPDSDIVKIRQEFDRVCNSFKSLAGTDPKGKPPWTIYYLRTRLEQVQSLQRSAYVLRGRALTEAELAAGTNLDEYVDSDLRRELDMIQLALTVGPQEYLSLVGLPGAAKSVRMKGIIGHLWDAFVLADAEAKNLRK